jgi:hypothetical protein
MKQRSHALDHIFRAALRLFVKRNPKGVRAEARNHREEYSHAELFFSCKPLSRYCATQLGERIR